MQYTLLGILTFCSVIVSHTEEIQSHTQRVVAPNNEMKILVLIIASDNLPVYEELQKLWRSYMHRDREHVEAYFIKGNPDLSTEYAIDGDIIWSRLPETIIPGILKKTILSIEAFLPRIGTEFNYVLRTNLSSFYRFPKLLEFLKTCPRSQFYCGRLNFYYNQLNKNFFGPGVGLGYCSGSGFILSPDLAQMLVDHKSSYFDNARAYDDEIIGELFRLKRVKMTGSPRLDFYSLDAWYKGKDTMPGDVFQIRVKSKYDRLHDDIIIYSELVERFYP